ncbi:HipA domain protein [Mobiluncus mulieris 28-1]|uniref:HipA domain-containing protein n=1 Tax=Mobiluncus mulieris TaxID=2052 RepID=UPI0001BE7FAF|nr:HipA domain-containing protein [Mobiluncus mulieris]EEZ91474.1 HipA domain protein [Mobiluncus mulieris 28-1]
MKTYNVLDAYLGGQLVGQFRRAGSKIRFVYDSGWLGQPISLGLPPENPNRNALPFLKGLLPDNEAVKTAWGRDYNVNPRDELSLLAAVGQDLPGAIQLTPERVAPNTQGHTQPLSEGSLEALMRALVSRDGAWTALSGERLDVPGKFSLAGGQAKTALYRSPDGKWWLPFGRFPSTHILKPEIRGRFPGSDINEAVCLAALRKLHIPASRESIESIGNVRVSVIERYDRVRSNGQVTRLHQEDICQILRIVPEKKYTYQGGPSASQTARVIREYAGTGAALNFIRQLAFNHVILGTDAHGKNFSLIEHADGLVELAPAYDVASYIPYMNVSGFRPLDNVFPAMPIGGASKYEQISPYRWEKLGFSAGLDPEQVVTVVREIIENTPDAMADTLREMREDVQGSPVSHLADGIRALAREGWTSGKRSFTLGKSVTAAGQAWSANIEAAGATVR